MDLVRVIMTLTELFNPSFFMLLGILLFTLSFLIFYFENKAREQNHKINSMFSLVSSITEELNNANMRIHYLMNGRGGIQEPLSNSNSNIHTVSIPSNTYSNDNKIEVSEDEEDEDEEDEDEDEEDDDEEDDEEDEEDDDTDVEDEEDHDIDDDKTYYQGNNHKEKSMMPTLEEFSDLDEDDSMNRLEEEEEPEKKNEIKILTIHNDNKENELIPLIESSDLKSIHVSLDNTNEYTDYKKLSVQQLKNVVLQKGLAGLEEVNKMKKGELHKLLGELNV